MKRGPREIVAAGAASLALGAIACNALRDDAPTAEPTTRDVAVTAKATAPAPAPSATPAAATAAAAPRQLCTGQPSRPAPKAGVRTAAAPGTAAPPASIPFGVGKWVWVNLWAAWCGPCKEEMPRLIEWQKKLTAAGVLIDLAFVSLDDDERQLQRFLEGQPPTGVRASYWLPEGGLRSAFVAALGVKDSPELPVQALVAPSGEIKCVIQGAIEDRDYPQLATLLGARR